MSEEIRNQINKVYNIDLKKKEGLTDFLFDYFLTMAQSKDIIPLVIRIVGDDPFNDIMKVPVTGVYAYPVPGNTWALTFSHYHLQDTVCTNRNVPKQLSTNMTDVRIDIFSDDDKRTISVDVIRFHDGNIELIHDATKDKEEIPRVTYSLVNSGCWTIGRYLEMFVLEYPNFDIFIRFISLGKGVEMTAPIYYIKLDDNTMTFSNENNPGNKSNPMKLQSIHEAYQQSEIERYVVNNKLDIHMIDDVVKPFRLVSTDIKYIELDTTNRAIYLQNEPKFKVR